MSFNIVDLVKDQIGGQLIEQMGGALGESRGSMDNAIGGAIPAILGSLVGRSQQSGGADALHRMLGEQDDGILDNIGNLIGGGQHAGFAEKGSGMLSSLLGGGGLGGIVGAISRFSGLGRGSSGSLIGMLAPIIMGVLKRNSGGMDAGGLASMLSGQGSNIAAAMPNGLGDALKGEGVLDSLGLDGLMGNVAGGVSSAAGSVSSAVGGAVDGVGDAVGNVADGVSDIGRSATGAAAGVAAGAAGVAGATASKGGGFLSKLLPIIILLAILFALWKFVWPMFSGGAEKAMETTSETTGAAVDAAKDTAGGAVDAATDTAAGAVDAAKDTAAGAVDAAKDAAGGAVDAATDTAAGAVDAAKDTAAGAVDAAKDTAGGAVDSAKEMASDAAGALPDVGEFSTNLGGLFDGATDALGGVTDAASAEAALPQLTDMGAKLDDMSSVFESIPEAARGPITSLVGDKMGGLQEVADKAIALPGVGDIIKPALEGIMSKLSAFGG